MKLKVTPFPFFSVLCLLLAACSSPAKPVETMLRPVSNQKKKEALPLPKPCDGFDFPVGPPDAKGYYNAQKFGKNSHLGDDWNGVGGGNSDKGDPVYAAASGLVQFADDIGEGWGNVMRVMHNIGTKETPILVESLYAHLDKMLLKSGEKVARGQQVGTIGDAHGAYWAHLHFELRDSLQMPIGGGYSNQTAGYLDPTIFIKAHRPAAE